MYKHPETPEITILTLRMQPHEQIFGAANCLSHVSSISGMSWRRTETATRAHALCSTASTWEGAQMQNGAVREVRHNAAPVQSAHKALCLFIKYIRLYCWVLSWALKQNF